MPTGHFASRVFDKDAYPTGDDGGSAIKLPPTLATTNLTRSYFN